MRRQAHPCGLCLTLRDTAGQAQRVLTGYDVLLLSVLLGSELHAAVHRALPRPDCPSLPPQREPERGGTGVFAATLAALTLIVPAVFIGGSYGGGTCGSGGRRRGYPPPQYGYRSVGPSCGQLLACNCCANLACNACCCGNGCANG